MSIFDLASLWTYLHNCVYHRDICLPGIANKVMKGPIFLPWLYLKMFRNMKSSFWKMKPKWPYVKILYFNTLACICICSLKSAYNIYAYKWYFKKHSLNDILLFTENLQIKKVGYPIRKKKTTSTCNVTQLGRFAMCNWILRLKW